MKYIWRFPGSLSVTFWYAKEVSWLLWRLSAPEAFIVQGAPCLFIQICVIEYCAWHSSQGTPLNVRPCVFKIVTFLKKSWSQYNSPHFLLESCTCYRDVNSCCTKAFRVLASFSPFIAQWFSDLRIQGCLWVPQRKPRTTFSILLWDMTVSVLPVCPPSHLKTCFGLSLGNSLRSSPQWTQSTVSNSFMVSLSHLWKKITFYTESHSERTWR